MHEADQALATSTERQLVHDSRPSLGIGTNRGSRSPWPNDDWPKTGSLSPAKAVRTGSFASSVLAIELQWASGNGRCAKRLGELQSQHLIALTPIHLQALARRADLYGDAAGRAAIAGQHPERSRGRRGPE